MTYVIINSVDLTQPMIDDCIQSSLVSVRKSLDGTQAILKYNGSQPASLSGKTEYTQAEILPIVQGSAWQEVL